MSNSLYPHPKYSYDSNLNLMIALDVNEQGMYDYIIPIKWFAKPTSIQRQIVPMRTVDNNRMYQRSKNTKLYSYGDIEISDHFMVQAKLKYNRSHQDIFVIAVINDLYRYLFAMAAN